MIHCYYYHYHLYYYYNYDHYYPSEKKFSPDCIFKRPCFQPPGFTKKSVQLPVFYLKLEPRGKDIMSKMNFFALFMKPNLLQNSCLWSDHDQRHDFRLKVREALVVCQSYNIASQHRAILNNCMPTHLKGLYYGDNHPFVSKWNADLYDSSLGYFSFCWVTHRLSK